MDHAGRADPVNFSATSEAASDVEYGPVRAAVSYVTVQLSDGTVLRLHPVSVYGIRYVAFAVPRHEPVSRITAYSARGRWPRRPRSTTRPGARPSSSGSGRASGACPGPAGRSARAGPVPGPGRSRRTWGHGVSASTATVDHVVITLAGGGNIRVPAVRVGEQTFFVFALSRGQRAVRWLAYDAARHQVGSGPVRM